MADHGASRLIRPTHARWTWRGRCDTAGRAERGTFMGGIRLFLALAVALAHFRESVPADSRISGLYTLGVGGGLAVLFFYAISGFLISTVLAQKYPADRDGTWAFYKARFVRIFSLYWPVLAVAAATDADVAQRFSQSSLIDRLTQI